MFADTPSPVCTRVGRPDLIVRVAVFAVVAFVALSCELFAHGSREAPSAPPLGSDSPASVILFVGDGMGSEHLRVAEQFRGEPGLGEWFSNRADVITLNAGGGIPDSAAAATAMATGQRVNNRVIAQARPGDRHDFPTVVDSYVDAGRSFGIVTTSELTHATPAAFAAHARTRNARSQIAEDYLAESRPDVLIGGGGAGLSIQSMESAGYDAFAALPDPGQSSARLAILLGNGHLPYVLDSPVDALRRPSLGRMVMAAIDVLSSDPDGFFLLVEAARIDHASHDNDIARALFETVDLLDAVEETLRWVDQRDADDILVIVTADHETGGLAGVRPGQEGEVPDVTWSTGGHTGMPVPVYALGPNADEVRGVLDNTDLYRVMMGEGVVPR